MDSPESRLMNLHPLKPSANVANSRVRVKGGLPHGKIRSHVHHDPVGRTLSQSEKSAVPCVESRKTGKERITAPDTAKCDA